MSSYYLGDIQNKMLCAYWDGKQVKFVLDGEVIGVYNPKVMKEPILFMQNTKANELSASAKEQITTFAKGIKVSDIKEYKKLYGNKEKIAKEIGVESEQLIGITEIKLGQKVEEKRKDNPDDGKVENKQQPQELTQGNIKETVNMSVMATDMKTLEQVLQRAGLIPNDGKTYDKIGVVETSDVVSKKRVQLDICLLQ